VYLEGVEIVRGLSWSWARGEDRKVMWGRLVGRVLLERMMITTINEHPLSFRETLVDDVSDNVLTT
jgi:hypothetical protein